MKDIFLDYLTAVAIASAFFILFMQEFQLWTI